MSPLCHHIKRHLKFSQMPFKAPQSFYIPTGTKTEIKLRLDKEIVQGLAADHLPKQHTPAPSPPLRQQLEAIPGKMLINYYNLYNANILSSFIYYSYSFCEILEIIRLFHFKTKE